jgi:starvation-inducible DNA-binding protein
LFLKIDEIAERILKLEHVPKHKYTDYIDKTGIPESNEVSDGIKAVEKILSAFKTLLTKQRHVLDLSTEINDEGTMH